jgi:hypothetical protein
MIIIPEKILVDTLNNVLRAYYKDLKQRESEGGCVAPSDVDTGFTISLVQVANVNVPQVVDISTINDVGGLTSGRSLKINTPSKQYTIWYKVNGIGEEPKDWERENILVNIELDDTSNDIAIKTANVLNDHEAFTVEPPTSNTLRIKNVESDSTWRSKLYYIFGSQDLEGMSYFSQMSYLLKEKYEGEQRKLGIYLGYNQNHEDFPQISLLLPSEEDNTKQTGVQSGSISFGDGTNAKGNEHFYNTTYNILITSDNYNDVSVLYHFIKTILLTAINDLQLNGLINPWVTGRDIMMDFDLAPMTLFHRTVAISFSYENRVPAIDEKVNIATLRFTRVKVK